MLHVYRMWFINKTDEKSSREPAEFCNSAP